MTTPQPEPDIHGMFDELTRPHTHRETYTTHRGLTTITVGHLTRVPSLVHQLLTAGGTTNGTGELAGAAYQSRPAARIEALDTVMVIDDQAAAWVRRLGEDDPGDTLDPRTDQPVRGSGTIACLRLLHGLHASAPHCGRAKGRRNLDAIWTHDNPHGWCCLRHWLEHDVRRWWHQARIITGWDLPPARPFNTCPVCEHRGGLRVNLQLPAAVCIECLSIWDGDSIGVLAEHIRAENGDDAA